jgi:hypothetical protein
VRAADAKQPRHPRFERRRHDGRFRPRADRDDVADAGHPRRNCGHQERRGQRKAAAGHVTPHAGDGFHPLLDQTPSATIVREVFGSCRAPPVRCAALPDRSPAAPGATRLRRHLVAAHFERSRHTIELPGKPDERGSPPPHAIDEAMDRRSKAASPRPRASGDSAPAYRSPR